ncbi:MULTISPECIES: DUF1876 domain-containing protein [unclassified Streptomyces]|uniref:DUF1876 domain-containing protein n=1 Tax=unclassified Streptomyces TaxID=2593676 RepID=UPI003418668B
MPHTLEWKCRLHIFENDGTTKARLTLDTGTSKFTGHGTAHRSPLDADIPEIGDEVAAGRALNDLARQLRRVAERDIEGVGAARPDTGEIAAWSL